MESKNKVTKYYRNRNICREKYYKNRLLHREDGPAIIEYYKDGTIREERYYKNGDFHREDGPALIEYDEDGNKMIEYYYKYNKKHREDGAAKVSYYVDGTISREECYINDELIFNSIEIENYIYTDKPIKIRNVVKLKLLYGIFKQRKLEDKEEEIGKKLLLKTLSQ